MNIVNLNYPFTIKRNFKCILSCVLNVFFRVSKFALAEIIYREYNKIWTDEFSVNFNTKGFNKNGSSYVLNLWTSYT